MKQLLFFVFLGLALFFFPLWFKGQLPFPGHLLVSFFSPFKEETWPGYPTGVPRQDLLGFDTVRQLYPWWHFSIDEIKAGRLPLWNPYTFAGAPHLANWQTALFFPLNWLYFVLPQATAWTILVLLQPILATIFAWLFLRSLKLNSQASILGAIAYGFSGWLIVWLQWNIHGFIYALIPLSLYSLQVAKPWLGLIVLTLIIFAGHPQIALFALLFYFLYGWFSRSRRHVLPIMLAAVLLTAIQWLPTLEYYLQASREHESTEFNLDNTVMPPLQFITLFAPTFFGHPATGNYWGQANYVESLSYVSLPLLIFAILALFLKPKRPFSFFAWSILAIVIWVLPTPLTQLLKLLSLPILSTSVVSRVLILLPLCLVTLAAFAFHHLNQIKLKHIWYPIAVSLGLLIFALLERTHTLIILRNLVIPFALIVITFALLLLSRRRRFFLWLFGFLIIFDLSYLAKKTITFTEAQFIYPSVPVIAYLQGQAGYERIGAEKASNLSSNLPLYYGLYSPEGYDTLYPRRLGELVWAAETGRYQDDFSRTTIVVPQFENQLNQRIMDLLSLKYVINQTASTSFDQGIYQLTWQQNHWQVYENLNALPRVKLFSQFQVLPDTKTAIETLLDPNFDIHNNLILSQPPSLLPQSGSIGQADITLYQPTKVVINTLTNSNQLLLLTDTYYPGWQALIDGQPTKIIRANHAFRAISVPEGNHQIIFRYQPLSVKLGLLIFLLGLSLIIFYVKTNLFSR